MLVQVTFVFLHAVLPRTYCIVSLFCTLQTVERGNSSEVRQCIQIVCVSSRDVKQMLLRLVELRSSNWGRVHAASASSEATPDNDPNYFMVRLGGKTGCCGI